VGTVPYRQFILSDGTTDTDSGILHAVDLIDRANGFCITSWQMRVAEPKSGGVWSDSSLADGRFLKVSKLANVQEVLTVEIVDFDADGLADALHLLYDLLEKARNWGPSGWSDEPVWIEAVGVNESNVRYALVHDYRTPGAGDPFHQPFWQRVIQSGISEFEIILEREPAWRGNYPGDADCVEISAYQENLAHYALVFDGATSFVDLGSPAALDNLAVGASFTVEAWIYAEGWGENNLGHIVDKSNNASVGWRLYIDSTVGLRGQVYFDVQDAISESGTDEFNATFFDAWHHVCMEFDNATKLISLYIDGTEVSSYATQQAGNNAAVADAATNAWIGNVAAGTRTFDGKIGWVRIYSALLYAGNFTPDERCVIPGGISGTGWSGIHEGTGSIIYDMSPNNNDGSASNTFWDDACYVTYGTYDPVNDELEEECDDEFAFIANKHNRIGLSHIFVDNGGIWGRNLLVDDPPYNLLPAVPANNDAVYFGIASTLLDAGPFCSLVFDLSSAITNVTTTAWEYWDGAAWSALNEQDNTNQDGDGTGVAFDTTGRKSVHWAQPDDWAANDPGMGVTGLWVRLRVVLIGVNPTGPSQSINRHVYTCLTPFLEIQKDQLYGNLPALARLYLQNQSDNTAGTRLQYSRVLMGLRSVGRGANFSAYINLSSKDTQQFQYIAATDTVLVRAIGAGAGTFAPDTTATTGEALFVTAPAAAWNTFGYCLFLGSLAEQYRGSFHIFVKAKQSSGSAGDLKFRVWLSYWTGLVAPSINSALFVSPEVEFTTTNDWQWLDFGEHTIDPVYGSFDVLSLRLNLDVYGNVPSDAVWYTVVLLPVDEWAIDAIDPYNDVYTFTGARDDYQVYGNALNVDNVSDPRRHRTTVHSTYGSQDIAVNWQGRAPHGAVLLPETRQRLWFVATRYDSLSTMEEQSQPYICGSVQAFATERYLLMRGDK